MPTNPNMVAIQTVTVGAGGASSIDFTNIPQTYTDLVVMTSVRGNQNNGVVYYVRFNGSSATNYSYRELLKDSTSGATSSSASSQDKMYLGIVGGATPTASTFSNDLLYIPNYTSSNNKSVSFDTVMENNSTTQWMGLTAGLWSNSSAITSISIFPSSGTWIEFSSATLYGVTSAAVGAKATGGAIYQDADYFYHAFFSSGTFTPTANLSADVMVIAGGGSACSGGGGAGGFRVLTSQSFSNGTAYTTTVGAGGASSGGTTPGSNGSNSSVSGTGFTTISATGGGRGGEINNNNATSGGSGGGGGRGSFFTQNGGAGNSGSYSPVEGYAGGNNNTSSPYNAGGGGGAGGVGANATTATYPSAGAAGGVGNSSYSTWAIATATGQNVSGTYYYAGGGGPGGDGGNSTPGVGGYGGGGAGNYSTTGASGTANTGGGGGGGGNSIGGSGGSGLIIIRYAK